MLFHNSDACGFTLKERQKDSLEELLGLEPVTFAN